MPISNTNNSLSDLNNEEELKINSYLTDEEITTREKTDETRRLEKDRIRNLSNETSNVKNKKDLDTQRVKLENSETNETYEDNKSLFDRHAIVDYARFIEDGDIQKNWLDYNSVNVENSPTDASATNNNETQTQKTKQFKPNSNRKINEVVPYNDSQADSNMGLTIPEIIEWSEKYPALQLKGQDFSFCKRITYYPNNRLIVLRRFKSGVSDNLFDMVTSASKKEFAQPIATMVTWWNPKDDLGDITFNENWETYKSGMMDTLAESSADILGGKSSSNKDSNKDSTNNPSTSLPFKDLVTALGSKALSDDFQRVDGNPYTNSFKGSPNSVHEAMARKTNGEGLSSKISMELDFEYELRDVMGIDPSIAMLDLISNCLRMGTSVSEFRYNNKFMLEDAKSIKSLINGDIEGFTKNFFEDLNTLTTALSDTATELISGLEQTFSSVSSIGDFVGNQIADSVKYMISRYRENLKAAIAADTGLASGIWHVTIGNPKAPIMSCGDMIIQSSKLKLGSELGYNDFPNSFKITYSLISARTRGRQELERIFNAGRGRVYVYDTAEKNPDYSLYSSGDKKDSNN